jgi:two-component system LytT family response regulator
MKALIVDDERLARKELMKLLEEHPSIEIVGEAMNAEEAINMVNELNPDLLFLDISMPGKNGFDLLQELTTAVPEVIFVTAHDDYMLQAFKFSAVDYLLKPVDENELEDAVNRAFTRIGQKKRTEGLNVLVHNLRPQLQTHEMKLCIPSQYGFEVILLQDVIYCEAESSYTKFHLPDKKMVITSKTIKEYEYLLADIFFVRVHRSYLINLKHVKEYRRGEEGTITMINGQEIKVAKRKKDFFLQKMKEYSKY